MKSVVLLVLGFMAGWLVHDIWLQKELLAPESDSFSSLIDSQTEKNSGEIEVEESRIDSVDETSNKWQATVGTASNDTDVDRCDDFQNNRTDCWRILMQRIMGSASTAEAILQLESWLVEYPDDLDAGLLLVDTMVKDRRFLLAIERLETIKDTQFDVEIIERVARKAESMIRSTDRMFHDNNALDGLIALYKILIDVEPLSSRWRYELSVVLQKSGQYELALDMLTYILYDAKYGQRATVLHRDISKTRESNDRHHIPLIKNGSQFLVDVKINQTTPLRLLIDTGASITSINKDILTRIGVNRGPTKAAKLVTANGSIETTLVKLDSLSVGDYSIQNIEAASISSLGEDLDGLLGMDFLGRFQFSIDQENRLLYLGQEGSQ